MITSDIFDISESIQHDKGILRYEYHTYDPTEGDSPDKRGSVRIIISQKDLIIHPSESYILFEGRLTKGDGSPYADADKVALANNGIMHLFESIKYQFGSNTIEEVSHPGVATTMLGLLKYSESFNRTSGLLQMWCKDTSNTIGDDNEGFTARQKFIITDPETKGTFSFIIPLKHLFGFADEYNKIMYGMSHILTFTRRGNDNHAIVHADGVGDGIVKLTKLQWLIPQVNPSDSMKLELYNTISEKKQLSFGFRSRRCEQLGALDSNTFSWTLPTQSEPNFPRYIIVGFQTDKEANQKTNPSLFNHLDTTMLRVRLDTNSYPEVDYELSFAENKFSRAYYDAVNFSMRYYGMDDLISNISISTSEYRSLYPLFVFDVSKQIERLKVSTVGIRIEGKFAKNPPANSKAYALVISDCICSLKSNGSELTLIT